MNGLTDCDENFVKYKYNDSSTHILIVWREKDVSTIESCCHYPCLYLYVKSQNS